jgi:hypothetical protein
MNALPICHQTQRLIARAIIEAGQWTDKQNVQEWVCDEHERQRELVAQRGSCEFGCGNRNIIEHPRGHAVCKWTYEPCPRLRLAALVEFYSRLNSSNGSFRKRKTMTQTTTSSALMPKASEEKLDIVDKMLAEFHSQIIRVDLGKLRKAKLLARARRLLDDHIDEEFLDDMMGLMNTQDGFKTDRNPDQYDRNGKRHTPYDRGTVKKCLIVALLAGAEPTGNEFNIIAGNCYFTKEFTTRAIRSFPGLTNFVYQIGDIAKFGEKAAKIEGYASYKVHGVSYEVVCRKTEVMDLRLVVNCYSNSSPDELRGRAEAKLFRQVLSRLYGLNLDLDDVDEHGEPLQATLPAKESEQKAIAQQPRPKVEQPAAETQVPKEAPKHASNSVAANHLLEAFIVDIQGLSLVSEVQGLLANREKLVDTSEWSDELKQQTIMAMVEKATETMDFIRNRRGEGSNR